MHQERVNRLIAKFDSLGVDGFMLVPPPQSLNLLPNVFYLTGFTGSTAILIITESKRLFLTDSRYLEDIGDSIANFEVFDNTFSPIAKLFPKLNESLGIKRLGIESGSVPVSQFNEWSEAFAPVELAPLKNVIEEMRVVKEASEIAVVREAIRINEESFRDAIGFVAEGARECDVAAEFEYALRKRGAKIASFVPIVASGPNSSKPHARFTDQVLVPGTPLTFDVGVVWNGYSSDMTRTVFFKDCPPEWKARYDAVLASKEAAESGMSAGIKGSEVDAISRSTIEEAGFALHCYNHGLGHGIGIQCHEAPRFAKTAENVIPEGALMTVEPGIYVPGEGGIRIEDIVIVRETGSENLNTLSTELEVVG